MIRRKKFILPVLAIDVPTPTGLVYRKEAVDIILEQAMSMCRGCTLLGWPSWHAPDNSDERKSWMNDRCNASHIVHSVWQSVKPGMPSLLSAAIEPLDTPFGDEILAMLKDHRVRLGIRAYGLLETGSTIVIPSSLTLKAIDALQEC